MISDPLLPLSSSEAPAFNWDTFLPFEMRCFKNLWEITSKRWKAVYITYALFTVGSLISLMSVLWKQWSDNNLIFSLNNVLFYMLYLGMGLAYILFPPLYMIHFQYVLDSGVTKVLVDAMRLDGSYKRRFHYICHFNFAMIVVTIVLYCASYPMTWFVRLMSIVMGPIYTFPNALAYNVCIMILDAHRVQTRLLLSDLEIDLSATGNSSFSDHGYDDCVVSHMEIEVNRRASENQLLDDVDDSINCISPNSIQGDSGLEDQCKRIRSYWRRYYKIQTECHRSSKLCGKMLVLLFCVSFVVIVSTVWDIIRGLYTVVSLLAYSLHSLVLLHEVMMLLVIVNETGNIISCRLSALAMGGIVRCFDKSSIPSTSSQNSLYSSYLLHRSHATSEDGNDRGETQVPRWSRISEFNQFVEEVKALIGCLTYAKIHFTFFGEFALRSSMLMAIVGSIFGAVLSAIYLR